ncbi:helix-turn-helix domain-containing protein, partial [Kitasatospora sp. NPDC057542]|uniref:helix-turn-helix domain-containing protein n=1 Tax=Kitasatospora sp. NPDC057542 TaxID=3346162 RepID=UPI0036B6A80F
MRFLLKGAKGSTKKLAQDLGVSQRTVQRWLKGQAVPKCECHKSGHTRPAGQSGPGRRAPPAEPFPG